MRKKIFFSLLGIICAGDLAAISFSKHGLIEVCRFRNQVDAAKGRVARIEKENQILRQQAELLRNASPQLLDLHLRQELGWVREGELVYFEPAKKQAKN